MRYAGGKNNFATKLANIIGSGDVLIEPFIGSGAMTAELAPSFRKVYAYDAHIDLVLMWQALLEGWIPPSVVTKSQYESLRHANSSALRGFAGFGCSFGGGWFSSYSIDLKKGQDYTLQAKNLLLRKVKRMKNVTVDIEYYQNLVIPKGATIYADPPYANAVTYRNPMEHNGEFNTREFWDIANRWANEGATVFVSEFDAPGDWPIVWEEERVRSMSNSKSYRNKTMIERLYCKG